MCCPQVARLSREHALFSALTYVFTHALGDYNAPLADMGWALAHLESQPQGQGQEQDQGQTQAWLAYKALAYLRCSLRGQHFPPGDAGAVHRQPAPVQRAGC